MLPPGCRMSDVDRTVEDSPEERSCDVCGQDAGECCCWEEEFIETPQSEEMGIVQGETSKAAQPDGTEREVPGDPRRGSEAA